MIHARQMLIDAVASGYSLTVRCDGETDYKGEQPLKAWDAVTAVEEATVILSKEGAKREFALILPDLAPDETIADCTDGGWIGNWMDQHLD